MSDRAAAYTAGLTGIPQVDKVPQEQRGGYFRQYAWITTKLRRDRGKPDGAAPAL
jgi:hypothetical protein